MATIPNLPKPKPPKEKLPDIADDEWDMLKSVCDVLEVFEEMTVELSAEKNVTVSKIPMMIEGSKRMLKEFRDAATSDNLASPTYLAFVIKVCENFRERMSLYNGVEVIDEAAILDPRFKHLTFRNNEARFKKSETGIMRMMSK